ncbi:hypothetical protein Cadr_000019669 [Camelus dromedarius]|uniref:Uncharacterized protein n=1 Tax=Camelus dromedarius TaxID=9838 RepID=A0A5N4D5Z9_CAMDR|nr:hypothetical protein Cadr_000019669 [Camelus dromedarius]
MTFWPRLNDMKEPAVRGEDEVVRAHNAYKYGGHSKELAGRRWRTRSRMEAGRPATGSDSALPRSGERSPCPGPCSGPSPAVPFPMGYGRGQRDMLREKAVSLGCNPPALGAEGAEGTNA